MGNQNMIETVHATTILAILRNGHGAMGGDGQLTVGETILKATSRKIRRLADQQVLIGFAGAAADALTLIEIFEEKLRTSQGDLHRAAIEMVKKWRTDKYLRRLEAQMAAMNTKTLLWISGTGDVVEPDDGIVALGSGGPYALAAARALAIHSKLPPEEIVRESLKIASEICIFTNANLTIEIIP
jgi:ATP-dependent HslUV protease subunit HslV